MTSTLPLSAVTSLVPYVDPLRIPPMRRPGTDSASLLTISARPVWTRLHSSLPPTLLWAYEGVSPGPTIEVRRGQRLRVAWRNDLSGRFPVVAVKVDAPNPGDPSPSDRPGREGATPIPEVAALPPWTVVHLHGAHVDGGSDGWPENGISPGDAQLAEYLNDQASTALWYHDHAMDITRWNVMTGLAGMYLIRDAEEDALHLPDGSHEVPLIIADRNLDTDATGQLTGQLLHKVVGAPGSTNADVTLPFAGPYTLVNGVIWPYLDVEPRWYRFRVLNASNARTYQLALVDKDGAPVTGAMYQIGTDSGLLPEPIPLTQLTLASAERADILIDFSGQRGKKLRLLNTLGTPLAPPAPPTPVMQFRVGVFPVWDWFTLPSRTSTSFTRITHDTLPADHGHRWIALTMPGPTRPHPEMWELRQIPSVADATEPTVTITDPDNGTRVFERISTSFNGTLNFMVEAGAWEAWNFINLATPGIMHPMHIHLVRFQAIRRDIYSINLADPDNAIATFDHAGTLDPNEQGWKDTIRVDGNQLVTVAGRFEGGTGRYVYHCHLLEHEDEGMMRPFVVMPGEVMAINPHEGDHH
ncbi:multicopper oxidase family protein [Actinoplanes regularis]|nr:multicopper oxidase domain-containing protein [Actinoplanes regularis]GIE90092.1 multicopper oxidase [Actinoplanes regularis]